MNELQPQINHEQLSEVDSLGSVSTAVHPILDRLKQSLDSVLTVLSAAAIIALPGSVDATRSVAPEVRGVQIVEPGQVPPEMMEQYLETQRKLEESLQNETVIYDSAR